MYFAISLLTDQIDYDISIIQNKEVIEKHVKNFSAEENCYLTQRNLTAIKKMEEKFSDFHNSHFSN